MIYKDEILDKDLKIRALRLEDCNSTYQSWLENPEVNKYLETRWKKWSIDEIKAFVSQVNESKDSCIFAIVLLDKDKHIGNIKIGPIHQHYNFAEISYFIGDPLSWGKGYASNAISLVCKFGFEKLKLHKIQAGVVGSNISSIRALEKCGFVKEGCFRQKLYSPSGAEDHLYYGLLKDELIL